MTPPPRSVLGGSLVFERTGEMLVAVQPDAISIVALGEGGSTMRLAIRGARGVAAFAEELWIATSDDLLSRIDYAGRALAAPRPLPFSPDALLQPAPCGPPAAVWSTSPALVFSDNDQPATPLDVELAIPLTSRRFVTVRGGRLTLPSGLVTMLPPRAVVFGGAVMADGKSVVLVITHAGGYELIVVSLGTGQIAQRHTMLSANVRLAIGRGLATWQLDTRTLRIVDLRAGRELGAVALDRDVIDHVLDPHGRWLIVRDAGFTVELLDLADILRTAPVSLVPPADRTRSGDGNAPPRARPRTLAITARGRYAHGAFTLPRDVCDELELRSPITREVLGVFPCGADDVDDAIASAAGARAHWAGLTVDARLAVLARIEPVIAQRGADLAAIAQGELGRPAWECWREVDGLVPRMRDLSTRARQQLSDVERGGASMQRRAHGVVGVVSPVMLPLASAHVQLMSALIGGNTVVWKPSSLAAGSAQLYAEILGAAGLPAGVFNLIQGRAAVSQRLLAHPGLDAAVFIGSRANAREVRRALCDRLELAAFVHAGAKNPAIVLDGADVEQAASEIATCGYLSSGQRATALGRVLVQAALLERLLEALTRQARRLAATPAFAGPLVSAARFDRHVERLRAAAAAGARAVLQAELRPGSLHVGPSIHMVDSADRAACATYLQDELFAPDLAIEPVADLSDAVARLRGQGALVASVFGAGDDVRVRCEHEFDAGALLWNHAPTALSGRLSFAAKGGPERGPNSLVAMTRRIAHVHGGAGLALPFTVELAPGARKRVAGLDAVGGRP